MTDDVYYWQAARRMWHQLEPVFAPFFYAPEIFEEAGALGYGTETRWPWYFPFRAAPLGAAGPNRVTAAFYSFSPAMVAKHIADAWTVAEPAQVLEARLHGIDRMYRRLMPDHLGTPELAELADLLRRVAESADTVGRPLAAATADLPWPDESHLVMWQAISLIREHRGDGHLAALLTNELDGCESLVTFAAIGAAPTETFASREWSDEDWAAATERLRSRGLLDEAGEATEACRELRDRIERQTDQLASGPWRVLDEKAVDRLVELNVPPLTGALLSGLLPGTNTLGIANVKAPAW
ncbi:SCO6745 family protein [Yinghuangia seranimata]|uniref:SCO6745 family protein n=1 Tax=Yinghuangia seranimata TaxID=408067 RepID=UPI00248B2430|nr:hypothetical protein [Yinghuangia seranimata]MDI2127229.1 hypothetical protein [Yinghuangia seranimata]